jgi:uncharacterized protein involved in exopolysaccharide biosynthesis
MDFFSDLLRTKMGANLHNIAAVRKTEDYKRELISIFFTRLRIILGTTAVITIIAILVAFFWPPTYASYGKILVKGKKIDKSPEMLEDTELKYFEVQKEDLFSEIEVLTSVNVINETVRSVKEKKLLDEYLAGKPQGFIDDVYNIGPNIRTVLVPASKIIEVTLLNKHPEAAVVLLNELMQQYMRHRMKVFYLSEAQDFFADQADKFKTDLEGKEDDLMGLVESTSISEPDKEIANNLLVKQGLLTELSKLRAEAIEKKLTVEGLDRAIKEKDIQFFSYLPSLVIKDLSFKLMEIYAERGNVARVYSPMSDKVRALDEQVEDTYAVLKREVGAVRDNVKNEFGRVNAKISGIEGMIREIDAQNVDYKRQFIEAERINREAKFLAFSYDTFSKRREEATINGIDNETNLSSFVTILSRPTPSDGPVFPKKLVVIPIGLVVGFIAGLSFGFLVEYFDHTFKKPSDVDSVTGLPLIFSIPDLGETDFKREL